MGIPPKEPGRKAAGTVSKEHLTLAQQVAHVGSWELDLDNLDNISTNPLRWSAETYRLLGYDPEKVEPNNDLFFNAVHPDDRDKIRQAVVQAINHHTPYSIEHRVVWPDGTERVLHERSTILFGNDGKPQKMLGTVQDITQRKTVEAAHNLPDLILRHMPDCVIMTDLEGQVTYWNSAATNLFGYTAQDMNGVSLARLYPTQDLNRFKTHMENLLKTSTSEGEWEALRRDGTRLWLHAHRTVIKNAARDPIGFLSVSKDITRQKKEHDAVLQSEQLYRAIGESINFGVWSCDANGRLTHLSESFMKLLGLTAAQNLSDGWLNALLPEERPVILEAWRECLATGKPWNRRYRIRAADGHLHTVITRAAPVRNDKGEITCWAGLNLDVDESSPNSDFIAP